MIDGIERNRQTIGALFSGYDKPIKSSNLDAFNKVIAKEYMGTEDNGTGQYYLDWRYNLRDEKSHIEDIADKYGLSVEFQSDDGYFEVYSSRRPIKSGYDENEISNLISKYTNELKSCTTGEEVQKVVHDFYYDENVSKYVTSIRTRSGKPINSFFTTNNPSEIEYTTDYDVGVRKCKVQNLYKLIRFELNIPYAYR